MAAAPRADADLDRRTAQRVKTHLTGRYMLPTREEFRCVVVDVSPLGLLIDGPRAGAIGDTIIAYVEQIGRVQGTVARLTKDGFAIQLANSKRAVRELAAALRTLSSTPVPAQIPDRRGEPRVEPNVVPFTLPENATYKVLNVSVSGAEVQTDDRAPIGTTIQIGRLKGAVVRHTPAGFAIEFTDVPPGTGLTDRIVDLITPPPRVRDEPSDRS